MAGIEYRYTIGAGAEGMLVFDGRVIEYFNLYEGGSSRYPYPECTFEKPEPNKKGNVDYRLMLPNGRYSEFPVGADDVAGFDDFIAKVEEASK